MLKLNESFKLFIWYCTFLSFLYFPIILSWMISCSNLYLVFLVTWLRYSSFLYFICLMAPCYWFIHFSTSLLVTLLSERHQNFLWTFKKTGGCLFYYGKWHPASYLEKSNSSTLCFCKNILKIMWIPYLCPKVCNCCNIRIQHETGIFLKCQHILNNNIISITWGLWYRGKISSRSLWSGRTRSSWAGNTYRHAPPQDAWPAAQRLYCGSFFVRNGTLVPPNPLLSLYPMKEQMTSLWQESSLGETAWIILYYYFKFYVFLLTDAYSECFN